MARFAGFYVAGEVITTLTANGPGGIELAVPGLTGPGAFPFVYNSGRPEDEFLTATQTVDSVTMTVGTDGEAVTNITYNKSGDIVITCMDSALLNVAMSAAHKAQVNQSLPFRFTIGIAVVDPNSPGSLISAPQCNILRSADISYGATAGDKAWTLKAAAIEINHGARVF